MKNHLGNRLKINVLGYRFENSNNKMHDSDWLSAELLIIDGENKFRVELEFLLVEELERIQYWLSGILNNTSDENNLDFIDPKLKMKLMRRSNREVVKVIYETTEKNKEVWELLANKNNLYEMISEIKSIMAMYPCRCGFTHLNT